MSKASSERHRPHRRRPYPLLASRVRHSFLKHTGRWEIRPGDVAIHLGRADGDRRDTQNIVETRVLPGRPVKITGFVASLGNRGVGITMGWDQDNATAACEAPVIEAPGIRFRTPCTS